MPYKTGYKTITKTEIIATRGIAITLCRQFLEKTTMTAPVFLVLRLPV
jgi:hypothetical protein